jgi:hypothetical protein
MKHEHKFVGGPAFKDMKCKTLVLRWDKDSNILRICECSVNYYDYMTPKVKAISDELKRLANDPEVAARGEELQRQLSSISFEELHRPFTI